MKEHQCPMDILLQIWLVQMHVKQKSIQQVQKKNNKNSYNFNETFHSYLCLYVYEKVHIIFQIFSLYTLKPIC